MAKMEEAVAAGADVPFAARCAAAKAFAALTPEECSAAQSGRLVEGEILHTTFGDVGLGVGPSGSRDEGVGRLMVTTRRVVWLSQAEPSKGYAVGYRAVMVHAVSRDLQAFDRPCIFVQLDSDFEDEGMPGANGEDDDEGGDPEEVSEIRLAPADPANLEPIFQAMSECAEMNPDTDGEEDEGEFFYNEEEVMAGVDPETRDAMLDHYDDIFHVPGGGDLDELVGDDPSRFDDAEEGEY